MENRIHNLPYNLQGSDKPLKNPFASFWMAGYECSDHQNAFGIRINSLELTNHIAQLEADYLLLQSLGIKTVREGICWSDVEKTPYEYDWSKVECRIRAGVLHGIQQIWDICHFGFPDDLSPLHPMFARRFACLCRAFVLHYRSVSPDAALIVIPINEVSFLSWLGGEVKGTSPYCTTYGWQVKYALMKAYIEGIEAMKEADGTVLILSTEPLINIVPPLHAAPHELSEAAKLNEEQFQVLDILCGRICPELRGRPSYPDLIGHNYYFNNQWETGSETMLEWQSGHSDPRLIPLHSLLQLAYHRYGKPVLLTETSHPGDERALWMEMICETAEIVVSEGIPFWGICWYPAINRPDWNHPEQWHESGLWDMERKRHHPTADVLRQFTTTAEQNV